MINKFVVLAVGAVNMWITLETRENTGFVSMDNFVGSCWTSREKPVDKNVGKNRKKNVLKFSTHNSHSIHFKLWINRLFRRIDFFL